MLQNVDCSAKRSRVFALHDVWRELRQLPCLPHKPQVLLLSTLVKTRSRQSSSSHAAVTSIHEWCFAGCCWWLSQLLMCCISSAANHFKKEKILHFSFSCIFAFKNSSNKIGNKSIYTRIYFFVSLVKNLKNYDGIIFNAGFFKYISAAMFIYKIVGIWVKTQNLSCEQLPTLQVSAL